MSSKHARLAVLAALVLVGAGFWSWNDSKAQTAATPPTRIAVVDIEKVFNDFQQTEDLNDQFEQRRKEMAAEAEKRRQAINQKKLELEAFAPDSPDYLPRNKELLRLQIEANVYEQMVKADLLRERKVWMELTYKQISDAIARLAKQRGYDLVLTYEELDTDVPDEAALRQQIMLRKVIYADPRVDLTDPVLEELNREYSSDTKIPCQSHLAYQNWPN